MSNLDYQQLPVGLDFVAVVGSDSAVVAVVVVLVNLDCYYWT